MSVSKWYHFGVRGLNAFGVRGFNEYLWSAGARPRTPKPAHGTPKPSGIAAWAILSFILICSWQQVFAITFDEIPAEPSYPAALYGQAYLNGLVGRGIGYQTGYCTLGLFLTDPRLPLLPFIDVRCHYSFQRLLASNLGIGTRFALPVLNTTFGVNFFYDTRNDLQDHRQAHYRQLGCGLELFTPFFDMRINGYLPVGSKLTTRENTVFAYPGGYYIVEELCQQALCGGELEIAITGNHWSTPPTFNPYVALGSYYYHQHCGGGFIGGKVRLGIDYHNLITCEIRASYDRIYRKMLQGLITIYFPFGDPMHTGFIETVKRQEIIVESKHSSFWKFNY